MSTRLFYVDDSGSEDTGLSVFGWVELAIDDWNTVLAAWLEWRHTLYSTVGIASDYELHATKFAGGRGRPTGTDWDRSKAQRAAVAEDALTQLATIPGLTLGAVYQRGTPGRLRGAKAETYARLVRYLDARLTAAGETGLLIMDGDGSDPTYRTAHRQHLKLATRSLIEDPLFQHSHHSQWVQMADLVAYAAYMHLARLPAKERMWSWWQRLAAVATTGTKPLDLREGPEKS